MSAIETKPTWLTVNQTAEREPAFTAASLRAIIFNSDDRKSSKGIIKGNGLNKHIRRVGAKVLINYEGFLTWIDDQHGSAE